VIRLERKNRNGDGKTYLEERYNIYRKLIEGSSLLIENSELSDFLTPKQNATIKRKTNDKIIDKFKLYCNLVENTNLNNTNIMDKLVPILINPTKKNDSINFQDKIELYCNLYDKIPDTNRELLDKLKPFILNNTQDNNEDNVRDRFLIYSDLMQYKDSIGNDSLEKIKTLLLDEIKLNCNEDIQFDYINQMLKNNNNNNNNNNNLQIMNKLQQITQSTLGIKRPMSSIIESRNDSEQIKHNPLLKLNPLIQRSGSNQEPHKSTATLFPEIFRSRQNSFAQQNPVEVKNSTLHEHDQNLTYNLEHDIESQGESDKI
jgi:hypothetical protein